MARYTAIIALFLCLKETNAQIKSFMNNGNLRQDTVQDGLFSNLGGSNILENITPNANLLPNSSPQRLSNFPSLPTNDHFSSNYHFSQQQSFNTPQAPNFPPKSLQRYQSPNSVAPSPFLKSLNCQETSNPQTIFSTQEPNQYLNQQTTPSNYLTPISDEPSTYLPEQTLYPDINNNLNPVVTVTESIPPPVLLNMAEVPPYYMPTVQIGHLLPTHAQPFNVFKNLAQPYNINPNFIFSSDLPLSAKPKPSIWKELLPLIIDIIKEERSRECCSCKCCCKRKRNNKLEVCEGYSNQKIYGQSDEEMPELDEENLSVAQSAQTSDEADKQSKEVQELEDDSEET